jgi:hypothetical protein
MVVGVDYDTFKATLCALPFERLDPPILLQARWRPNSKGGDALEHLGAVPEALGIVLPCLPDEPHVYFVERGFGMSRRSDFLLGAFLGAILAELRRGASANMVDLREWKSEVTERAGVGLTAKGRGNGNAKKEIANEACRVLLATLWGFDAGVWTPDELDAFGIAYLGRKLNARGVALAG